MQAQRNGECLKLLLEVLKPVVCPEMLKIVRRFARSHRATWDPASDEVFAVRKIPAEEELTGDE